MIAYKQVIDQIKNSENILIICHHGPDPDAIGAGGALLFYIEKYFPEKKALLANVDEFPSNLYFLGIPNYSSNLEDIELTSYDLIIVVDCGDLSRTGIADKFETIKNKVTTINIDHHDRNPNFADLNIVEQISSTSEILFKVFRSNKVEINKKISTCLLTGVTYDTDFFTNKATTKEAMITASELMKKAADMRSILRYTWKNKETETLKMWGAVLDQLYINQTHQVAVAVVPKTLKIDQDLFHDLNYYLLYLDDAKFTIMVRESEDGWVRCSLRTKRDDVDVSKIAELFGGGGHKKSAGFAVQGQLEKTSSGWKII